MNKKRKHFLFKLLAFTISLFVSLAAAEAYFRIKDHQPLFGEVETLKSPADPKLQEKVDWLSLQLAREKLADSLLPALYQEGPEKRKYGGTRNETELLLKDYPVNDIERNFNVVKVWNKKFLSQVYCNSDDQWYTSKMITAGSFIYAFDPHGGGSYPIFRYFPNTVSDKLRVNNFGWGGDSIAFIKPENTIRIAFLGASTTQQTTWCDFAYPDYIGKWLNEWAKAKHIPVKFEVINAARVGQKSMDIFAIMKYELAPVEPDITVYYEGKNQVVPSEISCMCEADKSFAYTSLLKSALVRRITALTDYDIFRQVENSKSKSNLRIPLRVKINAPEISSPYLPLNLPQILEDLDSIRLLNEQMNSTFVLCSYAMLTNEAMLTEGLKYASVYSYWMDQFPGLRLNDIGIINELENKVFKAYCDKNNVQFIDVAKELTRLPEAFVDGIHLNCEGMKYHAWIVFLDLLPVIEERLNNGTLPRKSTQTLSSHPYIKDTFERVALPYQCN